MKKLVLQYAPDKLIKFLRLLLSSVRQCRSKVEELLYPVKLFIYTRYIKIYPKSHKGYEHLLTLIYKYRYLDVVNYSKLFLSYFEKYKYIDPDCILKWRIKVCACHLMLNDIQSLQNTMQLYNDAQKSIIEKNHVTNDSVRVITGNTFEYYNVHAYLDTHIKAMKLGMQPNVELVQLLGSEKTLLNPVMMEYWKKYITVVEDEEKIKEYSAQRDYLEIDTDMAVTLDDVPVYIEYAKGQVQKKWEEQNKEPLFELTDEDKAFGKQQLKKLGIPENAWFVCLHVRDAGYKTGSYLNNESYDSYRNSDIDSYKLAIEEVINEGGYVIRVGDPKMKPLDNQHGLINYAHSDIRSNRMDIFLFSQCRFFIGVSSGPVLTPVLFGVPVVMSNFAPMVGRPHAGNCLFIPKMLWLKDQERYASFEEALSSDMGRIFSGEGYKNRNIEIVNNTPEELRDIVREMMDRLDDNMSYSEMDEKRQGKVTKLYEQYSGYGAMGRIGNSFIKKYAAQGLL